MKKVSILLFALPILAFSQIDQEEINEIQPSKIELGSSSTEFFIKDGQAYKFKQYPEIFRNPEAIHYLKRAKTNHTFASIISYAGGFGIGYGIGHVLGGGNKSNNPNAKSNKGTGWAIAGIGLGVTLTSIPLRFGIDKNLKKALDAENEVLTDSSVQLKLNVNSDGMGVAYSF